MKNISSLTFEKTVFGKVGLEVNVSGINLLLLVEVTKSNAFTALFDDSSSVEGSSSAVWSSSKDCLLQVCLSQLFDCFNLFIS